MHHDSNLRKKKLIKRNLKDKIPTKDCCGIPFGTDWDKIPKKMWNPIWKQIGTRFQRKISVESHWKLIGTRFQRKISVGIPLEAEWDKIPTKDKLWNPIGS